MLQNKKRLTTISKSEKSTRLVIHKWTKGCRQLYRAAGVYTVYDTTLGLCLYVGQSTDLGKRVRRFFNREFNHPTGLNAGAPVFIYKGEDGRVMKHQPVFLEITTISNLHHLDKFERTMIAIKRPVYNCLLNYNKKEEAQ